jgi:tetratricopeptide (TPR) repeat protein
MKYPMIAVVTLVAALNGTPAPAEMNDGVRALQDRWAEVRYEVAEKQRPAAYKALAKDADAMLAAQPGNVEVHVWTGIIHSTWAGEAGAFGAMKHAKRARKELELALSMDAAALDGAVYTSLGALLYQIPGIMGGDDEQAEAYLRKGLELNPEGIDSNYFYAVFLADRDRFSEAQTYVKRALAAPPRPGRDLADRGRRGEASELKDSIANQAGN